MDRYTSRDALVSSQLGVKMPPLCDSFIKSTSFAFAVSSAPTASRSFLAAYRPSITRLTLSKEGPRDNTDPRVIHLTTGRGRYKNVNAYGRGAEESVFEEEVPQMEENSPSFRVFPGQAYPLGVTELENGVNFAVFSQHASGITLCLSLPEREERDKLYDGMVELTLDPRVNKTGDIWHVCVEDLPWGDVLYVYRVDGPRGWHQGHRFDGSIILVDPYAKLIEGHRVFGDSSNKMAKFFGTYDFNSLPFNWGDNYKLPNIAEKDFVIYEMNVRAFTADESSGLDLSRRGSYLGVIEKINTWGYSTINFFAPMSRYAIAGGGPANASREFKEMVKALHGAGIEVILDVVYNHTNEADDDNPYTISFRGIDNKVYYMVDPNNSVHLLNLSGCGNTLNCNHPVVMELILDSLRHWVVDYHVDGFRFDLASVLCRGTDGSPLNSPPLIRAITKDAILSRCKIIAEPWAVEAFILSGNFQIGIGNLWAEWNGKYRDDIRKFIKGDAGMKGSFATRIAGSADLYRVNNRKPYHSINFIIAHDGFTLYDLVSYNSKHNDANGEDGNDGSIANFSWNCGCEGETTDANVKALRFRQMKNFHMALMVSQGTPMMVMGDEYGHTRYGNNNSYGHDTSINNFQWRQLEARKSGHFRFFSEMIKFRRSRHAFGRENFIGNDEVTWHEDQWDNPESKFLAFTLHDKDGGDVYLAFNAHNYVVKTAMPSPPKRRRWFRVVDTNLNSPDDFVPEGVPDIGTTYNVAPFSSILLEAKP